MNSMAIFLAASILSGVKSLASILVETSRASTMSMPSASVLVTLDDDLGLAMAIIINATVIMRSTNGRCLRTPAGPALRRPSPAVVDKDTYGLFLRS